MTDYKDTLNLPKTDFPMKADLHKREPEMLARWQKMNLYGLIRDNMAGSEKFILHDGPPYANANIHMGTALNKTLKDIVVKSKTLSGFDSPYVPGWDCHGLPIELNVEKKCGKAGDKLSAKEFRQACREYATTQVALQKADFERLGILGDWHNPYLTMQPSYEANAVRALGEIVKKGHLHRGQKPVHWCTACGSALAEAEVEYQDKKSPAVYVAFQVIQRSVIGDQGSVFDFIDPRSQIADTFFVIWTTTPWTLPANEAIAVNPEFEYALVQYNSEAHPAGWAYMILAEALVESVMTKLNCADYKILAKTLGKNLENTICQHPFLDRQVPIILGNHVTIEAGTGCVHTAPAHGQDDYVVGTKYHLPMKNPVNSQSCFNEDVPHFAGLHVFKANEPIIEKLSASGHLLYREDITHSYPHCWRHKTPLIFRATPQWFISMSQENLRELSLSAIKKVKWIPSWGENRITKMIEARPDWCISRQRAWGIPITLLIHKKTGELHPDIFNVMEKAAALIGENGIDAWHDCDINELINDADNYEKVTDVLDVWFESGVSHACVLAARSELSVPADLYLEGSDQHRGWFQSSLLTAVAMRNEAPFKGVLTHGYVVDAHGRKMSKSLGNTVSPADIVKNYGADILRLWAMSIDHTDDMSVSDEILKRASDTYRRIRNTLRFLISNLFDFNPEKDCVAEKDLLQLDRWVISHTQKLQNEIINNYNAYQFPAIYHAIHNFCAVELGGFYLDIIKDRLYTCKKDGAPRRSAQTALYYLCEAMVRWLAPITTFTADEIWQFMPGKRAQSVFLGQWYKCVGVSVGVSEEEMSFLIKIKNDINLMLEKYRADGKIGSALEAKVILHVSDTNYDLLSKFKNELKFLLIVSDCELIHARSVDAERYDVEVLAYPKCERCWHRREDVGANATHAGLCGRCVENVFGRGEERKFA